jgi:hypothetical protein
MANLQIVLDLDTKDVTEAYLEMGCGEIVAIDRNGSVHTGDASMPDTMFVSELESIAKVARTGLRVLRGDLKVKLEPKKKRSKK